MVIKDDIKQRIQVITEPYPLWIIDNFFQNEVLNDMKKYWPNLDSNTWHSGYDQIDGKENVLEQGMMAISKLNLMPQYIQNIFQYLYDSEFISLIENITGETNLVHDEMNWSGMRCMMKNSFQLIHSDARKHPKNNLKKEITCLLYLNDGYDKSKDEGCLEIWNDEMSSCIHQIEPIDNRLVIFKNSNTSYHGVPKVLSLRKSLLFNYCSTDDGTVNKRTKALFKGRPSDSEYINKIGLLRSKVNED
jgi:hypothetical protein